MASTYPTKRDDFFRAIGRFVFEFSQLEFTLWHFLAAAIELDNRFQEPVMSAFDFSKLCGAVDVVCSAELAPDHQKNLKIVIASCRKLNEERVRIVHGLWIIGPTFGSLHSVSRYSLKRSVHFDSHREIEALAVRAAQLRADLAGAVMAGPHVRRREKKG